MVHYSALEPGVPPRAPPASLAEPDTSTEFLAQQDAAGENDGPWDKARVNGAYRHLFAAFALTTLPMVIMPAVLLGLVFKYQVVQPPGQSPDLSHGLQGVDGDSSAYFVAYSATSLVTVASWASSIAPLASRFSMTLFSFPAARLILSESAADTNSKLPTPWQVSLYLRLQTGSVLALWDALRHRFSSRHQRLVPAVKIMLWGLFSSTLLSCFILTADTWLHVTTETVAFEQIIPQPSSNQVQTYGRGISELCLGYDVAKNNTPSCTVTRAATNYSLAGAANAYQALNNISSKNAIRSFVHQTNTIFYIGEPSPDTDFDFQASTYGASAHCSLITQKCGLHADGGPGMAFNCSKAFFGNAMLNSGEDGTSSAFNRSVFTDASLNEKLGFDSTSGPTKYSANPLYSADLTMSNIVQNPAFDANLEIVVPPHGGGAWIVQCNTTIYDVTYSWINSTVQSPTVSVSNTTVGGIMAAAMVAAFPNRDLSFAAEVASMAANTADLEATYAQALARETLAMSVGAISARPTLQSQSRISSLVARVPKAPLYALVALNFLYAALGLVLTVIGLAGHPRETRAVQGRFSVAGVTMACFEESAGPQSGEMRVDGSLQGIYEQQVHTKHESSRSGQDVRFRQSRAM